MNAGMNAQEFGFRLPASLALHCGAFVLPDFMREVEEMNFDFLFHCVTRLMI
jgi:hypothetical protein